MGTDDIEIEEDKKGNYKLNRVKLNLYLDQITQFINEHLEELNLKYKNILFNIQSEDMIVRRISIINIKNKKDILDMIAFEITQYVPINIKNYIIKYKILDSDISNMNLQVILLPKYLLDLCQEISNALNMKPTSLSINYDILQKMIDLELIEGFNNNAIFIEYKEREIILNMTRNRKIYESYILPRTNESYESLINMSNGFDKLYYYGVEDPYIEQSLKNLLNMQPLKISDSINILKNKCNCKEEYIKYINSIGMII